MKRFSLLILSITAFAVIIYFADLHTVVSKLTSISLSFLIIACVLQLVTIILINAQWVLIARHLHLPLSFRKMVHIQMLGTFMESVTPSVKIGGEAVKIYQLKQLETSSYASSTALVALQKTISMTGFLLLNLISIVLFIIQFGFRTPLSHLLLVGFLFLLLFTLLLLMMVISPRYANAFIRLMPLRKRIKGKLHGFTHHYQERVSSINFTYKLIIKHLLLSIFIWGLFACKAYLLSYSLGIDIRFISITIVTYLSYMVAMIPLLPGGVGSYEGSVILMLQSFGFPPAVGLTLAILIRFVTFWFVFLLSAIYLGMHSIWQLKRNRFLSKLN